MKNKKFGFTLAEVLITLAIIGVVAALTLPTLITNHTEKVTVTKVKKMYAVLNQAYEMAIAEHGSANNWDITTTFGLESNTKFAQYMLPYLSFARDCNKDGGTDCLYGNELLYLNGTPRSADYNTNTYYKILLHDGGLLWFRTNYKTGGGCLPNGITKEVCSLFWYDINGKKKPNQFGKDVFNFYGTADTLITIPEKDCFLSGEGWGCSKYIIENGNMNYPKE